MANNFQFLIKSRISEWINIGSNKIIDISNQIDAHIDNDTLIYYMKLEGIEPFGEVKNQAFEEYVDGQTRYYIPDVPRYADTDVILTMFFFGPECRKGYEWFIKELLLNRIVQYKDNGRMIGMVELLLKASEIQEENVRKENGQDIPYIVGKFTFRNLRGSVVHFKNEQDFDRF